MAEKHVTTMVEGGNVDCLKSIDWDRAVFAVSETKSALIGLAKMIEAADSNDALPWESIARLVSPLADKINTAAIKLVEWDASHDKLLEVASALWFTVESFEFSGEELVTVADTAAYLRPLGAAAVLNMIVEQLKECEVLMVEEEAAAEERLKQME